MCTIAGYVVCQSSDALRRLTVLVTALALAACVPPETPPAPSGNTSSVSGQSGTSSGSTGGHSDRDSAAWDHTSAPSEFTSAPSQVALGAVLAGGEGEILLAQSSEAPRVLDIDVADERSVEEGDIYRVLSGSLILNLNSYRGLQVIDFSDPSKPEIIGSLSILGSPVELYVLGDRAYVLLNSWHGFYGVPYRMELTERYGASVIAVDLSNPRAPELIDHAEIPGYIRTSRMVHADESAALYVATQISAYYPYLGSDSEPTPARAEIISFEVSDGTLERRGEVELEGYFSVIQATPTEILVARQALNESLDEPRTQTRVTLIDIHDPTGAILEGGSVWIDGYVMSQFNLDLHEGVLRVISSARWTNDASNTLQTFDASNIHDLQPIDALDFGAGQQLYATLFLGNKAFAVTFLRIDPFHAFEISAEGHVVEAMEYEVTGWNDFFRDVFGETRLIGVGSDQVGGRTVAAASLYDITDLTNPDPLIARARVDDSRGWSEARWDHRAFSVIEDAVNVQSPAGDVETGLVLLPFSARWSNSTQRSGVQIFTFSSESLTARGAMRQGAPVRRSFLADEALTANLSHNGLSLVDIRSVEEPEELGRLNLAPNYRDFFDLGEYGARIEAPNWDLGSSRLDVIDLAGDPDRAEALAGIDIPLYAALYQVGDLAMSVDQRKAGVRDLQVYDLTDPLAPRLASHLVETVGSNAYWNPGTVIDNATVFLQHEYHSEIIGSERVCREYPEDPYACWTQTTVDVNGAPLVKRVIVPDCTYYRGYGTCTQLEGEEPICYRSFYECYVDLDGITECEVIDGEEIATVETCYDRKRSRYWLERELKIVDLRDPDSAQIVSSTPFPSDAENIHLIPDHSNLWVSYRVRVEAAQVVHSGEIAPIEPVLPLVEYYIRKVDASNPREPILGPAINVPGRLLAIDGSILYTHDHRWQDEAVENTIVRLELIEGKAFEQAAYSLGKDQVSLVELDGAGHILISHRPPFEYPRRDPVIEIDLPLLTVDPALTVVGGSVITELARSSFPIFWNPTPEFLTVLAANETLEKLSTTEIGVSYSLREALPGRALYNAPGGVLILNLDDPEAPYFQAFLPTLGWPYRFTVIDRDLYVPAGPYGIFKFDLDEFNLIEP